MCLLGGIAAVIASHTPRRAYATAGIIAVLIIPPVIVELVGSIGRGGFARYVGTAEPGRRAGADQRHPVPARSPTDSSGSSRDLPDAVYLVSRRRLASCVTFGLTIRRYRRIAV